MFCNALIWLSWIRIRDPAAEKTHLRSWWDVKTFTGTRLGEQEWLMNRATFPYCKITAKIVSCL